MKVGVLGAGVMGAGVAQLPRPRAVRTICYDIDDDALALV